MNAGDLYDERRLLEDGVSMAAAGVVSVTHWDEPSVRMYLDDVSVVDGSLRIERRIYAREQLSSINITYGFTE